jgi:hypothetical protein
MTPRRPRPRARRDSGTITLWMLGLCLMLFLLGGSARPVARLLGATDAGRHRRRGSGRRSLRLSTKRSTGHRRSPARAGGCNAGRRRRCGSAGPARFVSPVSRATEDTVMVTVGGSVDFCCLQIVRPATRFAITVHDSPSSGFSVIVGHHTGTIQV